MVNSSRITTHNLRQQRISQNRFWIDFLWKCLSSSGFLFICYCYYFWRYSYAKGDRNCWKTPDSIFAFTFSPRLGFSGSRDFVNVYSQVAPFWTLVIDKNLVLFSWRKTRRESIPFELVCISTNSVTLWVKIPSTHLKLDLSSKGSQVKSLPLAPPLFSSSQEKIVSRTCAPKNRDASFDIMQRGEWWGEL